MSKFFDIVFTGPPAPESGQFVEVEDDQGKSQSLGEWLHRPDGFWVLRITDLRGENAMLRDMDREAHKTIGDLTDRNFELEHKLEVLLAAAKKLEPVLWENLVGGYQGEIEDLQDAIKVAEGTVLEAEEGTELEVIAREWAAAHDIIMDFLGEIVPAMTESQREHNASAIIARLASHEPPILLQMEAK